MTRENLQSVAIVIEEDNEIYQSSKRRETRHPAEQIVSVGKGKRKEFDGLVILPKLKKICLMNGL
ncbi:hypothetical protein G9A89_011986 [Geosiphon pyriformis]|nr:hypothetical protein G9A89_011986 [Geosiphon pyriformis]